MMLDTKSYVPEHEKKRVDLKLYSTDVLAREEHFELTAAQDIFRNILGFAGISEEDLKQTVESTGYQWYERGDEMRLPWSKSK
jgi:hypothetical protein